MDRISDREVVSVVVKDHHVENRDRTSDQNAFLTGDKGREKIHVIENFMFGRIKLKNINP